MVTIFNLLLLWTAKVMPPQSIGVVPINSIILYDDL